MARTRSISSIEAELTKAETDLAKAQEKVDALSSKVLELQRLKQEYEISQIANAYRKSGKTLQEILTFLDV